MTLGHSIKAQVGDWLESMPEGKTANWVLGNHDNWRFSQTSKIIVQIKLIKLNFRLGSRFGAGNIDGFNMMSLMLPGVAVTYNGEEIGMTNTEVSWEDMGQFTCTASNEAGVASVHTFLYPLASTAASHN